MAVLSCENIDPALAAAKQGSIRVGGRATSGKSHPGTTLFQGCEMEKSAREETQVSLHPFQCQTTAATTVRELV